MPARSPAPGRRVPTGFTLVEVMMAVTLMLMVFAAAVPFFRTQARSIDDQAGRFDATQTARFAISQVDKDLRVAGNWLGVGQPLLVQADTLAITFNADLVSSVHDAYSQYAVYVDSSAPLSTTGGLTRDARITLPNTSRLYPDSTYRKPGNTEPIDTETISYFLVADTRPGFTDRYQLRRRVNADTATLVAENVVLPPGERVFRYYTLGTGGVLTEIPTSRFPLYHTAIMHGSTADVGVARMTDSVRVVRMRLTVADVDPRRGERRQTFESNIRLRNAGLLNRPSCGAAPRLGSISLGTSIGGTAGARYVSLTWRPATDETSGERDVQAYLVYRRLTTDAAFSGVFQSIPADGSASYRFDDNAVTTGDRFVYGVAALDCTPLVSATTTTTSSTIP